MTPPKPRPRAVATYTGLVPAAKPAAQSSPVHPAFYLTMAFVFVVYARFPEILDMLTGSALHLARILMVLVFFTTLLFGGGLRSVFSKIGGGMLAFTAWMCICVPFSIWRGGSARTLRDSWVLALFSFVIIAASVHGLDQCRRLMYTLAAATAFMEVVTFTIGRLQSGRLALLGGTLGNANYLAMMLLMGVPFCLLVLQTKPGLSLLKLISLLTVLAVPVTVAGTGSRGGLVALGAMFLLYFIPLPSSQKLVAAMVALILAGVSIVGSARGALERYKVMFSNSDQIHISADERSAMESAELRRELLLSSLQLTMRHPLLGVGPGMFAVANADYTQETKGQADYNAWHETHNTFTQLSVEDGLPGLFLYCLTILLCFQVVFSVSRRARNNPAMASVVPMALALRLALVAFIGTSLFASNAYAYYFPMLAGLCVAFERAVAAQFAAAPASPQPQPKQRVVAAGLRPTVPRTGSATAWKNMPSR
jgi:O-antigen ligase